jgi:putative sigma-54 modulation protein
MIRRVEAFLLPGREPQLKRKRKSRPPRRVVKTKRLSRSNPCLVDEAISQMELLGHDFFLFTDADTERLNLLYRRADGDYGSD